MNKKLSPVLDDQPSLSDSLDFESYVNALKELVVHDKTRTPLTLGVFGRWGTGKTTLMRMLEKSLEKEGITTIWFNAWQYSDEDELWAAFLQSIINKILYSLGLFQLPVFKLKFFFRRLKWNEMPRLIFIFVFRVLVSIFPLLLIDPLSQQLTPEAGLFIAAGGNLTAFVLAVIIVGKPLVESIQKTAKVDFSEFRQTSNYQEHIAFLDMFREHFSDIVQSLPKKNDKRLAVFIDDLDRCSSERAIQVLDAIKLFVDVEGCVYILGLDVDVVQKAIAYKYKDDLVAQREYMSKIIQIPFQLPPLTQNEMRIFLQQLDLDLPDSKCQEVFIAGSSINPREVKRTINIFSLLWNLAAKRAELIDKISPVRLAKIVVIQYEYPDLHKILQHRPYLLIELERYFRNEQRKALQQESERVETIGTINNKEQTDQDISLPLEIIEYGKQEALRSILLLHELPKPSDDKTADAYSFANLKPNEVAVYFTLTSRVEAPSPDDLDMPYSHQSTLRKDSPLVGKIIGGRYQVNYEIGRGGMSEVYLVRDIRLEKEVALKILTQFNLDDPRLLKRFEREIRVLLKLKHQNIVPILDYGQENQRWYYTMQYFSGGTLKDRIKERGKLSKKEISKILFPILDALSYIHQNGLMHRDIKPSSIMFDENNHPFLADFGIVDFAEEQDITGFGVGTPLYMSPEQMIGKADLRSDLYSFGILLFECVTGQVPYFGDTPLAIALKKTNEPVPSPRQVNSEVSIKMEKLIMKLLAKDLGERYQTAMEVKTALLDALAT